MHVRSLLLAAGLAAFAPPAFAQAVFDIIDADKDGTVSRAELDKERLDRFLALDRNADGFVDRPEMMVGPGQGRKGYTAAEAQAMLSSYDLDGDGQISRDEVAESLQRVDVFANLDANGDGRLDRDEAAGILDTRPRDGIPLDQILADLAQGPRPRAGFRPLSAPEPATSIAQAQHQDTLGPAAASTFPLDPINPMVLAPRWDGDSAGSWQGQQGPSPETLPEGRSGYSARRVDPVNQWNGASDMFATGAVPPGPPGGVPLRMAPSAEPASGPNWREVPLDSQGNLTQPAPQPLPERRGFFARVFGTN